MNKGMEGLLYTLSEIDGMNPEAQAGILQDGATILAGLYRQALNAKPARRLVLLRDAAVLATALNEAALDMADEAMVEAILAKYSPVSPKA